MGVSGTGISFPRTARGQLNGEKERERGREREQPLVGGRKWRKAV